MWYACEGIRLWRLWLADSYDSLEYLKYRMREGAELLHNHDSHWQYYNIGTSCVWIEVKWRQKIMGAVACRLIYIYDGNIPSCATNRMRERAKDTGIPRSITLYIHVEVGKYGAVALRLIS